MLKEFTLPDLGEGIAEAQIVRVLIKPGDRIAEDQYLMEVETDKAAVEIPSPFAGIAKEVNVSEGQTVRVGDVIVTFETGNGAAGPPEPQASARAARSSPEPRASARARRPSAEDASSADETHVPARSTAPAPQTAPAPRKTTAPAAPAVRRIAREMGINLDTVTGTGPGGRITKEDLRQHAAGATHVAAATVSHVQPTPQPATPAPGIADSDKWGPIRRVPLNQIRKTIANQMSRSAFTAVHVTHVDEADITELDRMRRSLNEITGNNPKLTLMSFLIRATCVALRKHPAFNASFDEAGGQIIYKEYINIGVAVDTERGLIVPVIKNADQFDLRGIAVELVALAEKVRTNQFGIEDLRGGSFTITNVGALGGTFSTPIINYPEVAILGLGRSRVIPVVRNDEITKAPVLPLFVSFDHRATDGASAARFLREIISYMEEPGKFLLE